MLSISSILPVASIQYRLVTDGQTDELTDTRRQTPVSFCSLWGSPGALDPDVYWPAQLGCVWPRTWNRLPTALRSPELSLSSFKRQLKTHSSVPAHRRCWLQLLVSCTIVRRCCDGIASSAPTTNVLTRIPR